MLILLAPLAGQIAALLLGVIVTALLAALAAWALRGPERTLRGRGALDLRHRRTGGLGAS